MCGECCRSGYDIHVQEQDINQWRKLEKFEFLDNIIIKTQCISINDGTELNCEDGHIIKRIKKDYKNSDKKIEELIKFIQTNHDYYGKSCLRLDLKTIIPNLDYDPVLKPKNFNVILKGIELGLDYIIKTNVNGECPYLTLNLCSINDFKPIGCKKFPYTKDKCLRKDDFFLSICRGVKKIKEI